MKKQFAFAALVMAAVLSANQSAYAGFLIDSFDGTSSTVTRVPNGDTNGPPVGAATLGGFRDYTLTKDTTSAATVVARVNASTNLVIGATTFTPSPGKLEFDSTRISAGLYGDGSIKLLYDGRAPQGLANQSSSVFVTNAAFNGDITQNGLDKKIILTNLLINPALAIAGQSVTITISAFTWNAAFVPSSGIATHPLQSTYTTTVTTSGTITVPFTSFSAGVNGPANFHNIDALLILINPNNHVGKLTLDSIMTATPEPSSIALLGLGALGLVGYRLRRKKTVVA